MKVAGIDVSPGHAYLAISAPLIQCPPSEPIESHAKLAVADIPALCAGCSIVIVETPEVGMGWKPAAVRNVMQTIQTCGEIYGMLQGKLPDSTWIVKVSPAIIREYVVGIHRGSKGKHDGRIKDWLKHTHCKERFGCSSSHDTEYRRRLFTAKGSLSTADKRDAYLAALFGEQLLASRMMQIEILGAVL